MDKQSQTANRQQAQKTSAARSGFFSQMGSTANRWITTAANSQVVTDLNEQDRWMNEINPLAIGVHMLDTAGTLFEQGHYVGAAAAMTVAFLLVLPAGELATGAMGLVSGVEDAFAATTSRLGLFADGGVGEEGGVGRVMGETEPLFPSGTVGSARVWTNKARLKTANLPIEGRIRYVPPKGYNASEPLPRGPDNGYLDRFDHEWTKGPSRTMGQPFEWDVQLSLKA